MRHAPAHEPFLLGSTFSLPCEIALWRFHRAAGIPLLMFQLIGVMVGQPRTKEIAEGRIRPPIVVNESLLKRMDELLKMQLSHEVKEGKNHFEVVHSGKRFLETDSLGEVLADQNSPSNPITTLHVTALGPFPDIGALQGVPADELTRRLDQLFHDVFEDSRPRIDVWFGSDGLRWTAKGSDTAWVTATEVELETLVKSAEQSDYGLYRLRPAAGIIPALLIFLVGIWLARNNYNRKKGTQINLHDYVWNVRDPLWSDRPVRFWILVIGSAISGILSERAYTFMIRALFPRVVFELGDGVAVYQDILVLRHDILFGVIVGLLVAILGGIIVAWLASLFGQWSQRKSKDSGKTGAVPTK